MNLFDVGTIVLLVVAMWLGVRSGAVPQVFGLAGAAGAVVLLLLLAPWARDWLLSLDPPVRAFVTVGGAFLAIGLGEALGTTVGRAIRGRMGDGIAGRLDRMAGGLLGAGWALILVWLVGGLVAASSIPGAAGQAQRSVAVRTLSDVLPPPTAFTADLRRLLDASGLPQLFGGLEPLPASPVPLPGSSQANAIVAGAVSSVVRVDAAACTDELTATGFAVRGDYVVTNAHVVAGARSISVTPDGRGDRKPLAAVAVLFDPRSDVAVLWVRGLRAAALRFAPKAPERGTKAAALGHPNGGRLTVVPIGVTASYAARGFDLYGRSEVVRTLVELRGDIARGDSGGPLILPDGTVGGVVFAEARNDPAVGYALAPDQVAKSVTAGIGRTVAADLGPCVR